MHLSCADEEACVVKHGLRVLSFDTTWRMPCGSACAIGKGVVVCILTPLCDTARRLRTRQTARSPKHSRLAPEQQQNLHRNTFFSDTDEHHESLSPPRRCPAHERERGVRGRQALLPLCQFCVCPAPGGAQMSMSMLELLNCSTTATHVSK